MISFEVSTTTNIVGERGGPRLSNLVVHIPKLYEKRNHIMKNCVSVERIREEDENGVPYVVVEAFEMPGQESLVANYKTNLVTFYTGRKSKYIEELLARRIAMQPLEMSLVLDMPKKRKS